MAELEEIVLPEDMAPEEKESVLNYIQNGLPGIANAKSSDIFMWFELYMSGKTYSEIATVTNSKKDLVLYVAHKSKWFDQRMEHYSDLVGNIAKKLTHVKLSSANTMVNVVTALGKYYDKKFNKYLSQKDENVIDTLDTKLFTQYLKSMDALDKIVTDKKPKDPAGAEESGPLVNINMLGGATVEKTDTKTIEITDENAGEFLKQLANAKKTQSK